MKVMEGSLEEIEGINGFYLYGKDLNGATVFIHQLGTEPLGFDPNDDPELELAYDFTVV
jgi:hypothetical protein